MIVGADHASVDGNDPPDWDAFKAAAAASGSRAAFAIFRGAYGTWPDPTVQRDWRRAQDAGLITGSYLLLRMRADQPPEDQVHVFAENLGALRVGDLVPAIDVEDTGFDAQTELGWVHRAWTAMRQIYTVSPMIYVSDRVWSEDLHNLDAGEMTDSPLWVAKPWPWRVQTPAHLASFDGYDPIVPKPWGPGNAWIHQYQGDALPCPGFSHTVDLNRFRPMVQGETGARVAWVQKRLGIPVTFAYDAAMNTAVRSYQHQVGVAVDGVIGPVTFTRLAWSAAYPVA